MSDPRRTPLHTTHIDAGAKMVPFAGFEMPVQYAGVVEEHKNVRTNVGLFDVSHMGEVFFNGPGAVDAVDRIVTNHVGGLDDGQACYTVMCQPDGGIIDDLVVYRFSAERVMICVNAANRSKDFAWMKAQAGDRCAVTDESDAWVQIAVQGPKAEDLVARVCGESARAVATYRFIEGEVEGTSAIIARTGYTGEDGFELYVPADAGPRVWSALMSAGEDLAVAPAGLGARDSLRLEMCFPLYGNDIDEHTHPYEAGLGWVVKLNKDVEFIGADALRRIKAGGFARKLVPLVMTDRGIARGGHEILQDGQVVGRVTSGTKGPSVERAVALGYVQKALAKQGTRLEVDIRGRAVAAEVAARPFYRRTSGE